MDSEAYNLSRNDFQNSTSDAIKLLKLDKDFLDVTLACEDGKQVKAHKVVISSFSSVFHTILKENPHNHPLIYLTGINHRVLEMILDFIYLGEARVCKSEFDRFMEVAEKLKINGLVQYKDNPGTKDFYNVHNFPTQLSNVKILPKESYYDQTLQEESLDCLG